MVKNKILIFMSICYAKCSDIVVDYECSTFKQIYRKSECCEDNKAHIHLNYTCPDIPSPSPCPSPSPPSPCPSPPSPSPCPVAPPPPSCPPIPAPCTNGICCPKCPKCPALPPPTLCPSPPPPTLCPPPPACPPPPPPPCENGICSPIISPPPPCPAIPPPCPAIPPPCKNGICCPIKKCPAPSPPPPCPALPPPPTVCEGHLCKKPKNDRLDLILKRGVLNVGFPSVTVSGFTEYLTCPICKYPRPSGFLGCLLKSVSTAVFGKYSQSNTRTITNETKLERLYYGTVDMDVSYGVINNLPTKVNFPSAKSVTLDVDAQFATTSPAIFIDEKYHKLCRLCKHLDIKGKLIRAVYKKLALHPETKEFVMSAPQDTASHDMLMALITTIWKDVKDKTGVELVLVSSDASVESVGKSIKVTLLGELQVKTLDAVAGTDFDLLLKEPGTIQLTQHDKDTYDLGSFVTKHGLTFAYDVYGDMVNNKLISVSNKAVSCLNMLDKYGVHTVDDLTTVHPIVKHKVESDKVCHNILTHVGSMKTCRDEISKNADIDYTLNTH